MVLFKITLNIRDIIEGCVSKTVFSRPSQILTFYLAWIKQSLVTYFFDIFSNLFGSFWFRLLVALRFCDSRRIVIAVVSHC